MPDWLTVTEVVAVVAVSMVVLPVAGVVGRRRWLATRGRVLDCSLRLPSAPPGAGWMLGAARYRGERFEWYRVYSLSFRPRVILRRDEVIVTRVREPDAIEANALIDRQIVAELGGVHTGVWLAMERDDLTAFASWSEAGTPGSGFG